MGPSDLASPQGHAAAPPPDKARAVIHCDVLRHFFSRGTERRFREKYPLEAEKLSGKTGVMKNEPTKIYWASQDAPGVLESALQKHVGRMIKAGVHVDINDCGSERLFSSPEFGTFHWNRTTQCSGSIPLVPERTLGLLLLLGLYSDEALQMRVAYADGVPLTVDQRRELLQKQTGDRCSPILRVLCGVGLLNGSHPLAETATRRVVPF